MPCSTRRRWRVPCGEVRGGPNWAAAQVPARAGRGHGHGLESGWSSCARMTRGTPHTGSPSGESEVSSEFSGAPARLGPRSVSVVMEPLAGEGGARGGAARIADIADAELRSRGGFLATAGARAKATSSSNERPSSPTATGRSASRLRDGHRSVRAAARARLRRETEQAAGQCRLELRRLSVTRSEHSSVLSAGPGLS